MRLPLPRVVRVLLLVAAVDHAAGGSAFTCAPVLDGMEYVLTKDSCTCPDGKICDTVVLMYVHDAF